MGGGKGGDVLGFGNERVMGKWRKGEKEDWEEKIAKGGREEGKGKGKGEKENGEGEKKKGPKINSGGRITSWKEKGKGLLSWERLGDKVGSRGRSGEYDMLELKGSLVTTAGKV